MLNTTTIWSRNSTLRRIPKKTDTRCPHKKVHNNVTETLFMMVKGEKQTVVHYLATKRNNKILIQTTAQINLESIQFSSVQSLSHVRLFATPWIAARQASQSIANSRSSPRLTSIESVMPSSHLILCHPLLLLPPIPPSIRVFSNESTLRMRCW